MSQYALADQLAAVSGKSTMGRDRVARWERGRQIPRREWRQWLAVVLHVPAEQLDAGAAAARRQSRLGHAAALTPPPATGSARRPQGTPALLPVFRSRVQAGILAATLLNPDRAFSLTELAEHAGGSLASVSKEAKLLEDAGLLTRRNDGAIRLMRAATDRATLGPLTELIRGTYGVPQIVGEEFGRVSGVARIALTGTWAERFSGVIGPEPDVIQVRLVPDEHHQPGRQELAVAARRAERRLHRRVAFTVAPRPAPSGQRPASSGQRSGPSTQRAVPAAPRATPARQLTTASGPRIALTVRARPGGQPTTAGTPAPAARSGAAGPASPGPASPGPASPAPASPAPASPAPASPAPASPGPASPAPASPGPASPAPASPAPASPGQSGSGPSSAPPPGAEQPGRGQPGRGQPSHGTQPGHGGRRPTRPMDRIRIPRQRGTLPVVHVTPLTAADTTPIAAGGWREGASVVAELLAGSQLELFSGPTADGRPYFDLAEHHLAAAEDVIAGSAGSAFVLIDQAAQLVGRGLLAAQGLRPAAGADGDVVGRCVAAQFGPQFGHLELLRRRQLSLGHPVGRDNRVTATDVEAALPAVRSLLQTARSLVPQLDLFG